MTTRVRTIEFLPEIFKTKTNEQFLSATLDQLVQQPNFKRVQGFIGSKFGYGVSSGDAYLVEPDKTRTDYQLDPAVIFKKKDTEIAVDVITYSGLLDSISLEGGIIDNNNSLFSNQFYSWDSFVDLDKLINYNRYYWLPTGPDAITLATTSLYKNATYSITSETNSYKIAENNIAIEGSNPILTLVRGGTYMFEVNQTSKFWIQTAPGLSGVDETQENISTREIFGLTNNGLTVGTMSFTVPLSSDQDRFTTPGNLDVDLATFLPYSQVNGSTLLDLGGIDGVADLNGKTILFASPQPNVNVDLTDEFFDSTVFDTSLPTPLTSTVNAHYYTIQYVGDPANPILKLVEAGSLVNDQKITIRFGEKYITRNFVKSINSLGEVSVSLVPIQTATLDTLYYQDQSNPLRVGKIKLVDNATAASINIADIVGKKTYTSPNNVTLSNGMKIQFLGNIIPETYNKKQFYVEGVGSSIVLVPVSEQNVPEDFGTSFVTPFDEGPYDQYSYGAADEVPGDPDYITINRSSINRNPWSRSNRWFHEDILKTTIEKCVAAPIATAALGSSTARAKRPVIEFYPNLKLFNTGTIGKKPIDFVNFTVTDAFNQVQNQTSFSPDGATSSLFDGARIIFANDNNSEIRRKIYVVKFVTLTGQSTPVITLSVAPDGDSLVDEQTVVLKGENYIGESIHYNGNNWVLSQQKESVNQPPKFDVFNAAGVSFGDQNYYPSTDFDGCTLFEYAVGTGNNDPILGFPIKYSSISNLGDISFTATLNSQEFHYVDGLNSVTAKVSEGFAYTYSSRTEYTREIGWQTAIEDSFQYQVFDFEYTSSSTFVCDVAALSDTETNWNPIVVYVNNQRTTNFASVVGSFTTSITISDSLTAGDVVNVMVYSTQASKVGYYQIPTNLDHNPFNEQITNINLGDIRGHYKSICNNAPNLTGVAFGSNNYRDLGNLIPYGTRIIQNSAPIPAAAAFLRSRTNNFFDSVTFNSREYIKYKVLLLDTINRLDFNILQDNASILDAALDEISVSKVDSNPFFWSDMIPSGNASTVNSYSFKIGINSSVFPLTRVYSFDTANYHSVLVYLTRKVDSIMRTIQLIRGEDYTVSSTEKSVTVDTDLLPGDIITVKEYNQTYGSYIPNTPSKLGMYPSFKPEVVLDDTYVTPTYFIKGHDGSYSKLFGEYNDGYLEDFRDRALLEFETRIYNNIKVVAKIPVEYDDVFPGQFRETQYSYSNVQQMYTTAFLNWIGLNRVNYQTQYYQPTNEFTWNYSKATNKIDRKALQGNWRGAYIWMYDTSTPNKTPWEMLGLMNKPSWWDARYGEAPYTSENILLWTDISEGRIWNNGDPYINSKRVRPGLLNSLPVDESGTLLSPFSSIVSGYDKNSFKNDWKVGDVGPTEYSYLKSSSWPFDFMRLAALAKPASFFSLGLNLDNYKYNAEFNQYLVNGRTRKITNTVVYGTDNTSASHSYLNWLVDYERQFGVNGSSSIYDVLQSLDVRLTYRLAGFSDKEMLKFYVEKGSPNSKNSSLLIPDESYNIMLYENQPHDVITFSSVIIQKTATGYKVYGNSQNKAYFTALIPITNGNVETITVNTVSVAVGKNYSDNSYVVPYGTEFTTVSGLCEFVKGYGKFLERQGVVFTDIENSLELNWNQMIAEMLYWIQSGWEVGSTINVNPSANVITVQKDSHIVQPLTIQNQNFVLNQNLIPIQLKDLGVYRSGTTFSAKALNAGDSISFFTARLSNIEHVIVFDNSTVFNDSIFNLITGLRQQRLYVKGSKTAEWSGTMDAAGFIINQDNIKEWVENEKYTKGSIVKYKNSYWVARDGAIPPSNKFDTALWIKTDYNDIQKGLLPNPSTRAYESTLFYDANRANLERDSDLLSFSLVGYRPRDYLVQGDLDDITQVNVYKNMIGSKGTNQSITNLNGINLQNNTLEYNVHENWAIKVNEFGGVLKQNFVEFTLDQSQLTGNPSIVSLIDAQGVDGAQQLVGLSSLKNYGRSVTSANILPTMIGFQPEILPSAGYVNLDDVVATGYNIDVLSDSLINTVYKNDYIWVADSNNTWDIYTPVSMEILLKIVYNNLNGTLIFTFNKDHNLSEKDPIGILNFDERINGFYKVESVLDTRSVLVNGTLDASINMLESVGLPYKLYSQRVTAARDMVDLPLTANEYTNTNVWVDNSETGDWAVYKKQLNYFNSGFGQLVTKTEYGAAVAYVPGVGYFVTDPGQGKMYQYRYIGGAYKLINTFDGSGLGLTITRFGTEICYNDDYLMVSASNVDLYGSTSSYIFFYRIVKAISVQSLVLEQVEEFPAEYGRVGQSMAMSGNNEISYVTLADYGLVVPYHLDADYVFDNVKTFTATTATLSVQIPADTVNYTQQSYVDVTGNVTASFTAGTNVVIDFGTSGESGETVYVVSTSVYTSGTNTTRITMTTTIADASYLNVIPAGTILYKVNAMRLSTATVAGNSFFTVSGNWTANSMLPVGKLVSFSTDVTTDVYTLVTSIYDATAGTTTFYVAETIKSVVAANTLVSTASSHFSSVEYYNAYLGVAPDAYGNLVSIVLNTATVVGTSYIRLTGDYTWITSGSFVILNNGVVSATLTVVSTAFNGTYTTVNIVGTISTAFSTSTGIVIKNDETMLLSNNTVTSADDGFGFSMATDDSGATLFVGAPYTDLSNAVQDTGKVLIFNRASTSWEIQQDGHLGQFGVFILPWSPISLRKYDSIYINGKRLNSTMYVRVLNAILVDGSHLSAGDTVTYLSCDYVYEGSLLSYDTASQAKAGEQFGYSVACNTYASEVLVGCPFDRHAADNKEGAVYRFTHEGKRFGAYTGTSVATLPDSTYLLINGYSVNLAAGTASSIAAAINNANIANVLAEVSADDYLTIRLRDLSLNPINNRLNITTFVKSGVSGYDFGKPYSEYLGITQYTKTQVITDPHVQDRARFGYDIKFNQFGSFVVSSPVSDRYLGTTFDFTNDSNSHNDAVFDNNLTQWEDRFADAGSVYMYDYINTYNESLTNIGKFIYAQSCNDLDSDYGSIPEYGTALAFTDFTVMVGTPKFKPGTTGGKVVVYENSSKQQNWAVYRQASNIVNIDKVQKVQFYNNTDDTSIETLDYIDPLQGKLLGVVRENIDYIGTKDPAGYNNADNSKGSRVWNNLQIGKIWFDTTRTRFLHYHQNDVVYDSKHWGTVFPGSDVAVYTWIESDTTPAMYAGSGTPYDLTSYSVAYHNDASSNSVARYYFWVRNTNVLGKGKSITDSVLEQYIAAPQSSGIAFMAPVRPDTFALFNSSEYIKGKTTNMHIGYSLATGDANNHVQYKLVRTNYNDDFIPGLPNKQKGFLTPDGLYDRLLDSLAGSDEQGAVVPDPYLPKMVQTGVSTRPRQSFFFNRFDALKNYLEYANKVMIAYPVTEIENLTFLTSSSDEYDTAKYWDYVYWWATGYSNTTRASFDVEVYSQLLSLTPYEGLIVGVSKNSQGKREVYLYTNGAWSRIGLQNGTIQFNSSLWDYGTNKIGFGDNFFDSVNFDLYPSMETRYVVRALNEQIYVGPLFEHRNKSLILLLEYIESENIANNNHMPWLTKTSLVDVSYNVRQLLPFQKYQRDNQTFLEGYVNEVKPYHVVIKDFFLKYSGTDTFVGDITDFDLPPKYNDTIGRFVSPQLVYNTVYNSYQHLDTSPIWADNDYALWLANFGLTFEKANNTLVATLADYVSATGTTVIVANPRGLPIQGVVKIDDELISYTGIDRLTGMLTGVSRGIDGTLSVEHYVDSKVYMDLPEVIVLDSGRNYNEIPTVKAYIDTTIYPTPTREAVFKAVTSADRVISIDTIDPGEGYAVTPEIIVDYGISTTFVSNQSTVNATAGTIALDTTDFISGEIVKFETSDNNTGIIADGFYYIRVISNPTDTSSVVSLHTTYESCLSGEHPVQINSAYLNAPYTYTVGVTVRAIPTMSNTRTRGFTNTLRFDRTSYNTRIVEWTPNQFWSSPYVLSDSKSSTELIASTSSIKVSNVGTVLPVVSSTTNTAGTVLVTLDMSVSNLKAGQVKGLMAYFYTVYNPVLFKDTKGAWIYVYRPRFNPYTISSEYAYYVDPNHLGSYNDGDEITIRGDYVDTNGNSLGGVQYVNDAKISIKYVNNTGGIYISTISGTPVTVLNQYYLNPVATSQFEVYADAAFRIPVKAPFSFSTANEDYAYIPEPLTAGIGYQSMTSSLVSYNGKIYRCIESNNDSSFDYNKWEHIPTDDRSINALDRIAAFYEPTLDIPGKDITQLVKNVTYPNNIYLGNSFADEDVLPIDYVVKNAPYYPRNLNLRSIAYKKVSNTVDLYVAIADAPDENNSIVMLSSDAMNWTQLPISATLINVNEVFYNGEAFYISASHDTSPMYVSYDGEHWTSLGEPVIYDNTPFDFETYSSSDINVPRKPLENVYGVSTHLFAVGEDVLRSEDGGASWQTAFSFASQLTNTMRQITYINGDHFDGLIAVGGGQYVSAGAGTSNPTFSTTSRILTSIDQGNSWTSVPNLNSKELYFVAASNSMIVVGGENGTLWISTNAANWGPATISGTSVTRTLRSGAYGNNRFVVVGDHGTILVSTDGITWTQSTDSLITTKDLYKVKYLNGKFYAVGDTDTVMTSTDGHVWVNQANLEVVNPDYTIKGSDFLYGYGPEELVAGVITDNLSMQVKTLPGAYWDNDIVSQSIWYGHTGFAMASTTVKPTSTTVSFDGLVLNPAQISVYIVNDATGVARRIYTSTSSANPTYYTVQWLAKTITLQGTALTGTESIMVEAYEVGNGRQIARSNNQLTPMQVDSDTGHSMFVINAAFSDIVNEPVVFVNGVLKTYKTDYVVLPYKLAGSSTSIYKILFNTTYNDASDYVSFALLATTETKYTLDHFGYTVPLTQIFPGNTSVLTSSNTISSASTGHIIVEYNGSRLRPGTDYTVSGNNITMIGSYTSTGLLAVTTYHDVQRQYFATNTSTTLKTTAITAISTASSKVTITTSVDPGFVNSDLVRIDGIVGSTELNGNTYYVKRETATTYTLYTNSGLTTLASTSITAYVSGGFVWKDSLTYVATPPAVDSSMPAITYTDASRVWVTVNGKRVPNSKLRFSTGNKLSINVAISAGDVVLVTAMVSGSTPTETQYNLSVNKSGISEIYRSNQCDGTWLTQPLLSTDTTIYLKDASKVIKRVSQTVTAASTNGTIYAYVDCTYKDAKIFSVYNATTSASVTSYKLAIINDKPAVIFTSGVSSGNSVTVVIRYGDTIEVNGERIKFTDVNLSTNQLTGLSRGVQRTPVLDQSKYTMVYAINSYTKLPDMYNNTNWNTKVYYYKGDPLQMSTSAAATFLNTVII